MYITNNLRSWIETLDYSFPGKSLFIVASNWINRNVPKKSENTSGQRNYVYLTRVIY